MSIANNKKAFHDFFIEDQLEAGLVLEGWEVKAIRAGAGAAERKLYLLEKRRFLSGRLPHTALPTASTHVKPDPVRPRKLFVETIGNQ